jgi:UPF0271 protein
MPSIDLNCDLGEGAPHDAALMALITSANIPCGGHAGDRTTMRATAQLAARQHVAIGAHPSFPDRANFGRTDLRIPSADLRKTIAAQVRALAEIAPLRHVKPHGALYNLAARDAEIARVVAETVRDVDPRLILFALAGSKLVDAGRAAGLAVAEEVFADRGYRADGSLVPRGESGSLIEAADRSAEQVIRMITDREVISVDGQRVRIRADTVCLHGDGPHPVEFAQSIRANLARAGIHVRSYGTAS